METKEWRTVDRSKWPSGEWDGEPDKMQWTDEETGLPCLIVRNNGGALCGYVGVAEGHPLFGLAYNQCPLGDACPERKPDEGYQWCEHCPESFLRVHGGITFSSFCRDHGPEQWEKFRARRAEWEAEAKVYPEGDAAQRIHEWVGTFDDYTAWAQRAQETGICHIPAPGEPDRVWWFGFDCSHSGDVSPAYDHDRHFRFGGVYRDLAYVRQECANLARALISVPVKSQTEATAK